MEEIRRPRPISRKCREKTILANIACALVIVILMIGIVLAIILGILRTSGYDVKILRNTELHQSFSPDRLNSPNNGYHSQVDDDPNRFWTIVQEQGAKGNLDEYFAIKIPLADGTWVTEYVVSWRDY